MKVSDAQLDKLLAATSRQEIKSALGQRAMVPSLPQASRLATHLETLGPVVPVRLGVVHTYTSELLDPWLQFSAALNGLSLDIYHAPYGVTFQEAEAGSGLRRHEPDITLLLLRPEDLHPALQSPLARLDSSARDKVEVKLIEALSALVGRFRAALEGQIVVSLLPEPRGPGLGLYDGIAENSELHWWSAVKRSLATTLRDSFSGVSLLDMEQLLLRVGRQQFFDTRLWYNSVFPFTPDGALAVSGAVCDIAASLHLTRAKVIALDADNTLWGGVIGEDGMNGIALGPDYPGRAFVDFQKRILSLQQRGFILALCSKNNPDDLGEVLDNHPHQWLKREHFAAERVNWLPKPENLKSLAEELNLGLDAFIFVDDSDHECAAVRHALPEVEVVQVPARAVEIPTCLDSVARLQITSLTREDLQKTAMYAQERQRRSQLEELTSGGASMEDYLGSLNMRMTVGLDDESLLPRLSQLTQKTNQFNLTTRRYSEADMAQKIADAATSVYHFSLEDNFGDSGVVGLAIVEQDGEERAHLDSFLMSCRVIGRRAEQGFLRCIIERLRAGGVRELTAEYIPTRKNVLVETFLPDNAFEATGGEGYLTRLDDAAHTLGDDFPIDIQGPD